MKQASEMSKITLSVIIYAPYLNETTIKSNKKQMISSADTFFWMTRYHLFWYWAAKEVTQTHALRLMISLFSSTQLHVPHFPRGNMEAQHPWSSVKLVRDSRSRRNERKKVFGSCEFYANEFPFERNDIELSLPGDHWSFSLLSSAASL